MCEEQTSRLVVKRELVPVGVGERERPPEGAVDRRRHDGLAVGDQGIVDVLNARRVQPDRGADAGLGRGIRRRNSKRGAI
jgi:hypothetical protein